MEGDIDFDAKDDLVPSNNLEMLDSEENTHTDQNMMEWKAGHAEFLHGFACAVFTSLHHPSFKNTSLKIMSKMIRMQPNDLL